MRRNRGKILTKVQDVMGIKSGKYCSSDVSVVSLNGGGGKAQSHTLGNKPEAPTNTIGIPSVTYTNCPNSERKTINFNEIQMNNNIIPDCVLGGSVTLNDLSGYVVNYGDTICPTVIKSILNCDGISEKVAIDFGNNVVIDGEVYQLTFNGVTQPGCYTIVSNTTNPTDSISTTLVVKGGCGMCKRVAP